MVSLAKVLMLWLVLDFNLVPCTEDSHARPNCVSFNKQLVVSSIDPPSGTTGTDTTLSTRYVITGERLGDVSKISVEIKTFSGIKTIPLVNSVQEAASIKFHLATTALPPQGTNASVLIITVSPDCTPLVLTISLHHPSK